MAPKGQRAVATNRKARHEYSILDTFEAGIVLHGSEVKSLRDGRVQLGDAFARVEGGEAWLYGVNISPYAYANGFGVSDPDRRRKLLLHHGEIDELAERSNRERLTLIPLSIYFKDGRAKVELAVARGLRRVDRRQVIARRDADLEARRAMQRANQGRHADQPRRS